MSPPEPLFRDPERIAVLRVLDANFNRAAEGLRVVEDYLRFVLDDAHLTRLCKELRHELRVALPAVPDGARLAARETLRDVGTRISTAEEVRRRRTGDVAGASFHRVQQALRCLEEYGKIEWPAAAARIEALRYQVYTLERAAGMTARSLQRLAEARLYVLVDGRSSPEELADLARGLIGAGVHVLQLRDKALDDRILVERARLLRRLTRASGTLLIVNDRPDLAVLANADGVHVGQQELPVKDARAVVGPERLVGVSTHTLDQARQAVLDGADYLGCGPCFPSSTKSFEHYPGLDFLRAVAAEIRLPAFAIGGVSDANLDAVLGAGGTRVAVSGAVVQAADPVAAAARLRARLHADPGAVSDRGSSGCCAT